MESISRHTRIIDLTVGEFEDWIKGVFQNQTSSENRKYVYGLAGIMDLFNCSESTAIRYKKGIIKDACVQHGRKIMIDVSKAIELYKKHKESIR